MQKFFTTSFSALSSSTLKEGMQDLLGRQGRDQKKLALATAFPWFFGQKRGRVSTPLHCSKPQPQTFRPSAQPESRQISAWKARLWFVSFCPSTQRQAKQWPLFSYSSNYFLLTFLCHRAPSSLAVLTKWFLVPLETITLQENTTLLSRRTSHRAIGQGSIFHSRQALKPGTILPVALQFTQLPSPNPCLELTHPPLAAWSQKNSSIGDPTTQSSKPPSNPNVSSTPHSFAPKDHKHQIKSLSTTAAPGQDRSNV